MKALTSFFILVFASAAYAQDGRCFKDLTGPGYCVSKATAELACKKLGEDLGHLRTAKECLNSTSKVMTPAAAHKMCLGASVKTGDPERDSSNCSDQPSSGGGGKPPSQVVQ